MKKLLLISGFIFSISFSFAQNFITRWEVGQGQITFDAVTSGAVAYTWQTLPPSAPASGSGTFGSGSVVISGLPNGFGQQVELSIQPQNFQRIVTNPLGPNFGGLRLQEISQWGSVAWISMENAFKESGGLPFLLISATDVPDLSNVTSLAGMFESSQVFGPFNMNSWDVSTITDMSRMFRLCQLFNQTMSAWNTANVVNMSEMFEGCIVFNQNIGNWDTGSVTDMSSMFGGANSFNQNIGNWNTANVTDMSGMFSSGSGSNYAFNQNIGNWNTGSVVDMSSMFEEANNFNQDIGNWNTGNVTDMSSMFQAADSFDQNIGAWNTSNVLDMSDMFAPSFFISTGLPFNNGGSPSIQNWNVSSVTDMSGMFSKSAFNHSLGNWTLNPGVNLFGMLDNSAMDCLNYSLTLIDWSNNPNTPSNKILGATQLKYGLSGQVAVNNLMMNNSWLFSGHDFFNENATFSFQTVYCPGSTIPPLPLISDNGIEGTWSPALNNTTTTTYTFTPNTGECSDTVTRTITIDANNIVPTFNAVAPICPGANLAPLPTTSLNGVTGAWSPALNNTATTTYTFTPDPGQCAVIETLTINVTPGVTPVFSPISPICSGGSIANLPTTSNNGIQGTWSPALNNVATTTYTFTPFGGQCANTQTLTINVDPIVTPTFAAVPAICSGDTLSPLATTSNEGITGTWSPALNNTATTTYTFTPDTAQCANTQTLTINVNPIVTPTFATLPAICSGDTLVPLATTSNEGILGTWSPALNNTATTTYTFTPAVGQCANTQTLTISVTPNTTPTFASVTPICSGDTLSPLATTSNEGITGTWSPALNNTATTTYTFTPDSGQCANTSSLTIVIRPILTPTFAAIPSICEGDSLAPLPGTSNEGVTGTWSPALNNTATTTYTFTPDSGQCADTQTLTITVNSNPAPTGNTSQSFGANSTIADIMINPSTVVWYATLADALANVNPLPSNTPLVDGATYYAVNNTGSCKSDPLGVTVTTSVGLTDLSTQFLHVYPNPFKDQLYIENSEVIQTVELYDLTGKLIVRENYQDNNVTLNLTNLPNALYLVKVKSNNQLKEFKLVKE